MRVFALVLMAGLAAMPAEAAPASAVTTAAGAYADAPGALDQAQPPAPATGPAATPAPALPTATPAPAATPPQTATPPRAATPPQAPARPPGFPAQPQMPSAPALDLPATICNQTVGEPSRLPPAGGGPFLTAVMLCFEKQGGSPVVEANTYLYYLQLRGSQPSTGTWLPFDDAAQQTAIGDFKRLWATNFLDDLVIEVRDVRYSNGVSARSSSTTWKSASASRSSTTSVRRRSSSRRSKRS